MADSRNGQSVITPKETDKIAEERKMTVRWQLDKMADEMTKRLTGNIKGRREEDQDRWRLAQKLSDQMDNVS